MIPTPPPRLARSMRMGGCVRRPPPRGVLGHDPEHLRPMGLAPGVLGGPRLGEARRRGRLGGVDHVVRLQAEADKGVLRGREHAAGTEVWSGLMRKPVCTGGWIRSSAHEY